MTIRPEISDNFKNEDEPLTPPGAKESFNTSNRNRTVEDARSVRL